MNASPPAFGEPLPWFTGRSDVNPQYRIHSTGGRYVVLLLIKDSQAPAAGAALGLIQARAALFDDAFASCFTITRSAGDERRLASTPPGRRVIFDTDGAISALLGAGDGLWLLIDPMLRVMAAVPLPQGQLLLDHLAKLPPPERHAGMPMHAPVLIVPRVLEPDLCQALIALYEQEGGEESGVMREVDGQTKLVLDPGFKKRSDVMIEDEALRQALQVRIKRRLAPEILKAYQADITRMERYLIACYNGAAGGYFMPHRDNTTKGTAHRRFAVTINLNLGEYDGGGLRFPEYGRQIYHAPTGGAVVFSCSLLHEAAPVTKGKRYAFLPFLYDEAGARVREANIGHLDPALGGRYKALPEGA